MVTAEVHGQNKQSVSPFLTLGCCSGCCPQLPVLPLSVTGLLFLVSFGTCLWDAAQGLGLRCPSIPSCRAQLPLGAALPHPHSAPSAGASQPLAKLWRRKLGNVEKKKPRAGTKPVPKTPQHYWGGERSQSPGASLNCSTESLRAVTRCPSRHTRSTARCSAFLCQLSLPDDSCCS